MSPTPPLMFTAGQKVGNLASFFHRSRLWSALFRHGAIYRKCKTGMIMISLNVDLKISPISPVIFERESKSATKIWLNSSKFGLILVLRRCDFEMVQNLKTETISTCRWLAYVHTKFDVVRSSTHLWRICRWKNEPRNLFSLPTHAANLLEIKDTRGWVPGWPWNIHSEISSNFSVIFTGSQNVRNLGWFSTPIAFEALWFRNGGTYRK